MCWCGNHQQCQCEKHGKECEGSWHRKDNWSGRPFCDHCMKNCEED